MGILDPSPNVEGMCIHHCPLWYAHWRQIGASYKPPGAALLLNRMAAPLPVVSAWSPFLARYREAQGCTEKLLHWKATARAKLGPLQVQVHDKGNCKCTTASALLQVHYCKCTTASALLQVHHCKCTCFLTLLQVTQQSAHAKLIGIEHKAAHDRHWTQSCAWPALNTKVYMYIYIYMFIYEKINYLWAAWRQIMYEKQIMFLWKTNYFWKTYVPMKIWKNRKMETP